MIKKCKVISYNKFLHILVFEFEGVLIQMTHTIEKDTKEIYVKFDSGKYTIIEKNEYEKYVKRNKSKSYEGFNRDENKIL